MDAITVTAKTLDEAITKAAIELGTSSDNLDYTVEEQNAGFLGLFGKNVTIRAWKKTNDDLDKLYAEVVEGRGSRKPVSGESREKGAKRELRKENPATAYPAGEPKKEKKEPKEEKKVPIEEKKEPIEEKKEPTEGKKVPEEEAPQAKESAKDISAPKKEYKKEKKDNRREFKTEFKTESKYEVKSMKGREIPKNQEKEVRTENMRTVRKDSRTENTHMSYRESVEAEREAQRLAEEKRAEKERARKEIKKPVNVEECRGAAEDFLNQVFAAMGMEVKVEAVYDDEEVEMTVNLEGDDMGILIGKRGQTLDSLQYLTSLVVNKHTEGYLRVKLDTENYRARRKETLEALAKNIAYKVKRTRRSVSLEPMNPYERRIIHSALQNDKYVITRSEGEDPYRHVVVSLKREVRERDRRGGYGRQNSQSIPGSQQTGPQTQSELQNTDAEE